MEKYKQIKCDICNKTYGINYIYVHKQSKKHHKNIIKHDKKNELLNDNMNDKIEEDINDYINNIELNINIIKNYYNK